MSLTLTAAMLLAMAPAGPADVARDSYNKCLTTFTNQSLDAAMQPSDFTTAIQEQCQKEKQAFIAEVVKAELQYGDSKAEAESYANEEAQMIVDSYVGNYGELLSSNTRMGG